jgi:hypothetical protein
MRANHIQPQTKENWASRPLCHTQASDRQISSWVGDHQRIPAVVCFCPFVLRQNLENLDFNYPVGRCGSKHELSEPRDCCGLRYQGIHNTNTAPAAPGVVLTIFNQLCWKATYGRLSSYVLQYYL